MTHFLTPAFLQAALLLTVTIFQAQAQVQPATEKKIQYQDIFKQGITAPANVHHQKRTVSCGPDTLLYAQAKASSLQALTVNLTTSADKLAQYFNAPQPITVHGFNFYAWKSDSSGGQVNMWAKIYKAGPDSLPMGSAIDSVQIPIDSTFGGGSLDTLRKTVQFNNPVTVDTPYILSVESLISLDVAMVTNSWDSLDGNQNRVGLVHLNGQGWFHNLDINVGNQPFDADNVIEPYVTYDLSSNFSVDTSCFGNSGTVNFSSTSSPILRSPYYNQLAFLDTTSLSYQWDFGDGSPIGLSQNVQHQYQQAFNNRVVQTNMLTGWSVTCVDSSVQVINQSVISSFNFQNTGLQVNFSEEITGTPDSVLWTFGDNDSSSQLNPTHTYDSTGQFQVCLLATSPCNSDITCRQVQVCQPISSQFNSTSNGKTISFSSTVSGNDTLYWTFDDNSTSSMANPSHTFSSPGNFEVCLFAANACETDTTCKMLTVCDSLGGDFSFTKNGNTINFNSNVAGADSLYWTFGDGVTSTNPNPSHGFSGSGPFETCLHFTNACVEDSACETITITSIGDLQNNDLIDVYPVPTTGKLNIRLPQSVLSEETTQLSIYSVDGQLVKRQVIGNHQKTVHSIDLSSREAGVYLLKLQNDDQTTTRKVTILR